MTDTPRELRPVEKDARSCQGNPGVVSNTEIVSEPMAVGAPEACRVLGIGRRLLWTLTNTKQIPHVRLGRRVVYPTAALRAWLDERAEKGGRW